MKAKALFIVTVIFSLSSVLSSCGDDELTIHQFGEFEYEGHEYIAEDVVYAKGSRLKAEYQVYSDSTKKVFNVYEYDDKGRISKVNHGSTVHAYDIYVYSDNGELERVTTHMMYVSPTPVPSRSVSYLYDVNGNKIKETVEYHIDDEGIIYDDVVTYTYDDQKLTKKESFSKGELQYFIIYDYNDSGNVSTERLYVPGSDSFSLTSHVYEGDLLIYSITQSDNGFLYDSKKIYDKNGNLIWRIDNIPSLSSSYPATAFLVTRLYEYE